MDINTQSLNQYSGEYQPQPNYYPARYDQQFNPYANCWPPNQTCIQPNQEVYNYSLKSQINIVESTIKEENKQAIRARYKEQSKNSIVDTIFEKDGSIIRISRNGVLNTECKVFSHKIEASYILYCTSDPGKEVLYIKWKGCNSNPEMFVSLDENEFKNFKRGLSKSNIKVLPTRNKKDTLEKALLSIKENSIKESIPLRYGWYSFINSEQKEITVRLLPNDMSIPCWIIIMEEKCK